MSYAKNQKIRNLAPIVNIFDDFFGREFQEILFNDRSAFKPSVNVLEKDDSFEIELAAPGLKKDDFKVNIEKDSLTISLHKENKTEEKAANKYLRKEFGFASFKRSFTLPDSVNTESIEGKYEAGILHLSLPKREESKVKPAREVEIG